MGFIVFNIAAVIVCILLIVWLVNIFIKHSKLPETKQKEDIIWADYALWVSAIIIFALIYGGVYWW